MLSTPKLRLKSEKGNLYGFIADWNVVILDGNGKTLKDNIPGYSRESDVAYGDMDKAGSKLTGIFEEDELKAFNTAKSISEKTSALKELFGACATVPEGFVVGTDPSKIMRYVGEWSSRPGRRYPATVPGVDVKLTDGSRELLAMVAFEGHKRMDVAVYCEGILTAMWGHKFRIPDEYLYDSEIASLRGFADMDPGTMKPFVEAYRDDILENYDTPIGREIVSRFG